ncbi:MAG: GlsB/YeaQ/YmgE family stress response membrane protein [Verrucomicrobia bacterium]|nr:GlsB/YeaQ/YmgE family stress response membrane protein [Verrucomicrobiota bacterium]MBV9642759.1 GlsB/YeaQ/YmgE family stress response membrane protein [Verrucomicrobiota bacterium]
MNIGQIIVWIIIGGFAGTLAGRAVTFKKEGLGRWANLLVGMIGAMIGGELFKLFRIDFGLGELKVTFEDLIAAFLGSLLVIFLWRIIARVKAKNVKNQRFKS